MRAKYISALLALSFSVVACSGGGSAPSAFAPSSSANLPALSNAATIPASSGGTIALGNGAELDVQPNILASNERVAIAYDPMIKQAAPNPGWAIASGQLAISLPGGTTHPAPVRLFRVPPSRAPLGLTLRMPYTPSDAARVQAANAPLVTLVDASGSRRIVLGGSFDTVHHLVTVTIPRAMLSGVTSVQLALGIDRYARALKTATMAGGGRYWVDATGAWSAAPIPTDPQARTLVAVHGIFSSVESAFSCAHAYTTAASSQPGAYDQIVGFDYDYTQPPSVEGPLLAQFINQLGLTNYDIEAHSYGTLVALGALSNLTTQPNRAILVGGPLPLRGSPLVTSPWIRDILLSLASVTFATPQQVDDALDSGMVATLATDSPELQQLQTQVWNLPNPPRFERVAGTKQYWEEYLFDWTLWGTIDFPWDGVVEEEAAESQDLPYDQQTEIPYQHVGLPCDQPTIDFVLAQQ